MLVVFACLLTVGVYSQSPTQQLTWRQRGMDGGPSARSDLLLVSNRSHAFVIGGVDENGDEDSGTYAFNPDGTWSADLTDTMTGSPSSRPFSFVGTASAEDDSRIYVFGGEAVESATATNKVFQLSTDTLEWKDLDPSVPSGFLAPVARLNAHMVHLRKCDGVLDRSCLVVFGGKTAGGALLGDTYAVTELDTDSTRAWSLPSAAQADSPVRRELGTMVPDAAGSRAILFGGLTDSDEVLGDLWMVSSEGYLTEDGLSNIALNKPTGRLNQLSVYAASRAVDGNTNTVVSGGSCYHSLGGSGSTDPRMWVDLERPAAVQRIRVYIRTDCCTTRNQGIQVALTDSVDAAEWDDDLKECTSPLAPTDQPTGTHIDFACDGQVGQYAIVYIPGTGKIMQICEIEVMGPEPYKWLQLGGGIEEVSRGMPAEQSSTRLNNAAGWALDGTTNGNFNAGSCTHTSQSSGDRWWRVDLGTTVDVSSVELWDRTDCCTDRLSNFYITVGNIKDDWSANPSCPDVPSTVGTSANIACPLRGRFVFVAMHTGPLTLCEVKVFANKLLDSPTPRYGHAAVTTRGSMFLFGGVNAEGTALSDVHVFDTVGLGFKTTLSLVGDSPQERFGARLQQLAGAEQLILFGGRSSAVSSSDAIADLRMLEMTGCSDVDTTGVSSSNNFRGAIYYTCDSAQGFTERNPVEGDPVVCSPEGQLQGRMPVCQAEPPEAPRSVTATGGQEQATVQWEFPPGADTGYYSTITGFKVRSLPQAFVESFDNPSLATGWTYVDNGQAESVYEQVFEDDGNGVLIMRGGDNINCWRSTERDCPILYREHFPLGLTDEEGTSGWMEENDWAVEVWVGMEAGYIGNARLGGIMFYELNDDMHKLYYGYRRNSNIYQINLEKDGTAYQSTTTGQYGAWLRAERTGSSKLIDFTFKTCEEGETRQECYNNRGWFQMWTQFPESWLRDGGMENVRVGLFVKSWTTGDTAFRFDDFVLKIRDCTTPGPTRFISAEDAATATANSYQAVIPGLSSLVSYRFDVAAGTQAGFGEEADPSRAVEISAATPSEVEVGRLKPVTSNGQCCNGVPSAATDTNYGLSHSGNGCTHSSWLYGPWIRIDLQKQEFVTRVEVAGRTDCCRNRNNGFRVYIGDNSGGPLENVQCTVDYAWNAPQLMTYVPVNCNLPGRYVFITKQAWAYLSVCDTRIWALDGCEDRSSPNAAATSGSVCTSALTGDECTLSCSSGYSASAGSASAVCRKGSWSAPDLVCSQQCPARPAPAGAETCLQTVMKEDFSSSALAQRRFTSLAEDYTPSSKHIFAIDGMLVLAPSREGCQGVSDVLSAVYGETDGVVALATDPDPRTISDGFHRISTRLRIEPAESYGSAGIVFRAADSATYYQAVISTIPESQLNVAASSGISDSTASSQQIVLQRSGVGVSIGEGALSLSSGEWHDIVVYLDGQVFTLEINGAVVVQVEDSTIPSGDVGLFVTPGPAQALFDDFEVEKSCSVTGGEAVSGCRGTNNQDTCKISCRTGFDLVSPSGGIQGSGDSILAVDRCQLNGTWVLGTAPTCLIRPPRLNNQTRSIDENSARNTPVGDPMTAELDATDEQLEYSILKGNDGDTFKIGLCDGQLAVKDPTLLDFESRTSFSLTVRIGVNEYPGSHIDVGVEIDILDVNEPPSLPSDARIFTNENIGNGSFVGVSLGSIAIDPENDPLTFRLSFDESQRIGITADGQMYMSLGDGESPFNYEGADGGLSAPEFLAIVEIRDIADNRVEELLRVEVQDVNDAPVIESDQVLVVDEYGAVLFNGTGSGNEFRTFAPQLQALDEDSGMWLSDLTYSLASTGNISTADGTTTGQPLTDGISNLFAIESTSGQISVMNKPAPRDWSDSRDFRPYLSEVVAGGELVRAVYETTVSVTDGNLTDTQPITLVVRANLTDTPIIDSFSCDELPLIATTATDCIFTGQHLGTSGSTIRAHFNRTDPATGSEQRVDLQNCQPGAVPEEGFTCTTPGDGMGYGRGFSLFAVVDDDSTIIATSQLFDYAEPAVTEIGISAYSLVTAGGTEIRIQGTNLGPLGKRRLLYQRPFGSSNGLARFECQETALLSAYEPQQNFTCASVVGSGANLHWALVVNGEVGFSSLSGQFEGGSPPESSIASETVVGTAASVPFSYAQPFVSSVVGIDSVDKDMLSGAGGQTVRISGGNLGPASAAVTVMYRLSPVSASLGSTTLGMDDYEYTMEACTKPFASSSQVHTVIDCVLASGVGAGLEMVIEVDGVRSSEVLDYAGPEGESQIPADVRLISYAPPTITTVLNGEDVDTRGGRQVQLEGSGFGPAFLATLGSITEVRYGPPDSSLRYVAEDCQVSTNTRMQCLMVPGTGGQLEFRVTMANLASDVLPSNASYAAPTISNFEGAGSDDADTAGGEQVTVHGLNFGPTVSEAAFQSRVAVEYTVSLDNGPQDDVTFMASGCSLITAHETIRCDTAPGAGRALRWSILLDGQRSTNPTTAYAEPIVHKIWRVGEEGSEVLDADPNGGDRLWIIGEQFGPPELTFGEQSLTLLQSITFGQSGRQYEVPHSLYTHINHTHIQVTLPPASGTRHWFRIMVADQATSQPEEDAAYFDFASAEVLSVSPATAGTYSSAESPTQIELVTRNVPLADPLSRVMVNFGYDSIVPTSVLQDSSNLRRQLVRFSLPEHGAGASIPVQVGLAPVSQSEDVEADTSASATIIEDSLSEVSYSSIFSYDDPVLDRAVVTRPAWLEPGYVIPTINTTANDGDITTEEERVCPFSAGDPFTCDQQDVVQVKIFGTNLGHPQANRASSSGRFVRLSVALDPAINGFPVYERDWNHEQLLLYTSEQAATVILSIQSEAWPTGETVQSDSIEYLDLAPYVSAIEGNIDNVPTRGHSTDDSAGPGSNGITMRVSGLQFVTNLRVLAKGATAADATPCRVWDPVNSVWMAADESSATIKQQVVDSQTSVAAGEAYEISFLAPAGEGSDQSMWIDRDGTFSAGDSKYSYAPPVAVMVDVWTAEPSEIGTYSARQLASNWHTVVVGADQSAEGRWLEIPTLGGYVRVRGANMGQCAYVEAAEAQDGGLLGGYSCGAQGILDYGHPSDSTISGASRFDCAPEGVDESDTSGLQDSLHDCFVSAVPMGEGDGLFYGDAQPYSLRVMVGDQALHLAQRAADVANQLGTTITQLDQQAASQASAIRNSEDTNALVLSVGDTVQLLQRSVPLRYFAPQVLGISAFPSGTIPTKGGSSLTISGSNFGTTIPGRDSLSGSNSSTAQQLVLVEIGLPTGVSSSSRRLQDEQYAYVECSDSTRQSQYEVTCTLPEGFGENLPVRVTVAGRTGEPMTAALSYDGPEVTGLALHGLDSTLVDFASSVVLEQLDPTGILQRDALPVAALPSELVDADALAIGGPVIEVVSGGSIVLSGLPSGGGYNVTILGQNFGRRGLLPTSGSGQTFELCVFNAWTYRRRAQDLLCDGLESFAGEGEVAQHKVFIHEHEAITFQVPPAVLQRDVELSVGGRLLNLDIEAASHPRLRFASPILQSLAPATGGTEGGFEVTIRGHLFGPTPRNTTQASQQLSLGYFSPGLSIDEAASVPTTYMRVNFFRSCISDARTLVGGRPLGVYETSCQYTIEQRNENEIILRAPGGIGTNRPVSIVLEDTALSEGRVVEGGEGSDILFPDVGGLTAESNQLAFSYSPPRIDRVVPQQLRLTPPGDIEDYWNALTEARDLSAAADGAGESDITIINEFTQRPLTDLLHNWGSVDENVIIRVSQQQLLNGTYWLPDSAPRSTVALYGYNYGNSDLADQQDWTTEERKIIGEVAAVQCVSISRVAGSFPRDTDPIGETTRQIDCVVPHMTVGFKNVSLQVAGQTGFVPASPPLDGVFFACDDGAFGIEGEHCVPCPLGADCQGYEDSSQTHTMPIPQTGWYNLNSSDSITQEMNEACPASNQVPGRDVCIVRCEPDFACIGDNRCADAYKSEAPSFRCGSCADGYYRQSGQCVECPDNPWILMAAFGILVLVGAFGAYWINKRDINVALAASGIDYMQSLAIFASARVSWPPMILEMLTVLSAFNLNLEITAPECIVPDLGYITKWAFLMLVPAAVIAVFAMFFVCYFVYTWCVKGRGLKDSTDHVDMLIKAVCVMFYVLYLNLARLTADALNCVPTDPPEYDEEGKVIRYFQAVFEPCNSPGSVYLTLLPFTLLAMVVYVIGFPAWASYILYMYRKDIVADQLLRAKGTGDTKSTATEGSLLMRKRYSRLYMQFTPNYVSWVLVILARKLGLALTALMFVQNAAFQLSMALLVLFLSYSAHVHNNPYMSPGDRDAVIRDHITRRVDQGSLHHQIWTDIQRIESRGRKRATYSKGLDVTNARALFVSLSSVVFGSALFDYNTVEALLLFSAIMVVLAGIMFESGQLDSEFYQSQRDMLTILVILIVVSTLLYFAVVIVLDIVEMCKNSVDDEKKKKMAVGKTKGGGRGDARSQIAVGQSQSGDAELGHGGLDKVTTENNPMMMRRPGNDGKSSNGATASQLDASTAGIMAMDAAQVPDQASWELFRGAYGDMAQHVEQLRAENTLLKRDAAGAEQVLALGGGGAGGTTGAGGSRNPLGGRKRRTTFAPKTSSKGPTGVADDASVAAAAAAGAMSVASLKGLRRGSRRGSKRALVTAGSAGEST